jgi:hypothetical protein
MLTIFTIPKPFQGLSRIIQRNALQSWIALEPKCEVVMCGGEEGLSETASEFGIFQMREISKNRFGTPLISAAFESVRKFAGRDTLAYVNADMILMQDFIDAVKKIDLPSFLMIGRRWDLNVDREMHFHNGNWQEDLRYRVRSEGKLHGLSGIDYFVFPRHWEHNLPPFAVGRPGWDNWLIFHARTLKVPVIDATACLTAVHQNHESVYRTRKREVEENIRIGGLDRMSTIRDADWILDEKGLRRSPYPRRLLSVFLLSRPGSTFLLMKRKAQNFFAYR